MPTETSDYDAPDDTVLAVAPDFDDGVALALDPETSALKHAATIDELDPESDATAPTGRSDAQPAEQTFLERCRATAAALLN